MLLVIGMPLSVFLMSVSQFALSANWLFEGRFKEKFRILKSRKSIIVFMLIFLVHVIWMAFSSNLDYGLHDLKIKVPLFILPLIIGTSKKLSFEKIKYIILFLSLAVFVGTIISIINYFAINNNEYFDSRKLSVFISHIRFALLINVSIFSLIYFTVFEQNRMLKFGFIALSIWLIVYLFILQSLTGLVILFVISLIYLLYKAINSKIKIFKYISIIFLIIIPIFTFIYLNKSINNFYGNSEKNVFILEEKTPWGDYYYHDTINKTVENGNLLYIYLCENELRNEWNKKSRIKYDSLDLKGQEIKYTIIRYLTSKNLRKDGESLLKLSKEDFDAIENGCTNYLFANEFSFNKKIYETIWEIDNYIKTGNPSGHSLTMRIEFLRAATNIIKRNFLIGVGTGDLKIEFNKEYELSNSKLTIEWRLRAHNQLVTFFIAFGIIGFLIIMFSIIFPIFYEKKYRVFLFNIFFTIALLSMINEDTLETQAGVTFFALLYCLFIFGLEKKE